MITTQFFFKEFLNITQWMIFIYINIPDRMHICIWYQNQLEHIMYGMLFESLVNWLQIYELI